VRYLEAKPRRSVYLSARPLVAAIDDDRVGRFALSLLLKDWGYDVVEGDNGSAVLEALGDRRQRLAAIVTDFHLQDGETGVGVALRVAAEVGRPLPTLVITGSFGRKAEHDAKPHGFRVLSKPIEPELLRQLVSAMVARSEDRSPEAG
jgi:two-component system, sensor histidine kinase